MEPDRNLLAELVRRIVETVHPLRIILFGSAARGELGPDSDLDVLVVMPDGTHRRNTAQFLHTRMFGLGAPVDILVATPRDLDRHRDNIGLIYRTILLEGREIYPPEPGSARDWLRFAKADLAMASAPLPEDGLYEQLCFHAQQAVEKSLKALLVQMGIPFPKTHSIAHLIDLLPATIQRPRELVESAGLTAYATVFRYPGEGEPIEAAARDEAVRLAERVYAWALDLVEGRGSAP